MKTEEEIREEIERLKKVLEGLNWGSDMYAAQNSRLWTLRWVLGDEKA